MQHTNRLRIAILIIAGFQLVACGTASVTTPKIEPAQIETIEGSDVKQVVLTEKAAERIGLQTAPVTEEQVVRTRKVGGEVVAIGNKVVSSTVSTAANSGGVLVRVSLSESDLTVIDRAQSALVTSLADSQAAALSSQPVLVTSSTDAEDATVNSQPDEAPAGDASVEDAEDVDTALYYALDSADHGLTPGQRVFVELTLLGSGTQQKAVPYSAVIYDVNGGTWVYTNPEGLAFVREAVVVDFIDGDQAVLLEGPPVGTAVVTVGGALLYGAETGVSK